MSNGPNGSAAATERGLLIRRALDLLGAPKLGVRMGLEEIRAEETYAMLILDDERNRFERERLNPDGR
jgi:hypothetical protein